MLSIIAWTFLVVLFVFLTHWLISYWKFVSVIDRIPGPPTVPFFGNLFLTKSNNVELFKQDRENGRKYFPIYRQRVFRSGAVSVLKPEDVEIFLTSNIHITKGDIYKALQNWLGTGLLTSTGSKWQKRRKILTPAFHFTILQDFVNVFNEGTERLVQSLDQHAQEPFVEITTPILEYTLHAMAETSMGINLDVEQDTIGEYKKAIHEFGQILTYRIIRPWLIDDFVFSLTSKAGIASKVIKSLHTFTTNVINERKSTFEQVDNYAKFKRLAMLDLLLKYRKDGADINDEGIREEVDTFMFEGHDTTSVALNNLLFIIANHKEAQDEIREEILSVLGSDSKPDYNSLQNLPYTERCIKECLRLYPSVPFISRIAGEDVVTSTGHKIPKGINVHIHIYDIHRNPDVFPDPEKFDPDRFLPDNIKNRHPFAYVPFSAGPRNCIGQRFALLELKAALCGILRRFQLEPVDSPKDVTFLTDLVLRTTDGIRVKVRKLHT